MQMQTRPFEKYRKKRSRSATPFLRRAMPSNGFKQNSKRWLLAKQLAKCDLHDISSIPVHTNTGIFFLDVRTCFQLCVGSVYHALSQSAMDIIFTHEFCTIAYRWNVCKIRHVLQNLFVAVYLLAGILSISF